MDRKKIKALREKAEELLKVGVANRDQLIVAVPALVELQDAEKSQSRLLSETKDVIKELSDACSAYALRHPEYVFDQTYAVLPSGVESGDIEIDGRTYHFKHGFKGYVRTESGKSLTQEFLEGLPEDWTKSSLSLDTTAVNKADLEVDALAEFGLMRKVDDTWSELG